MSEETTYGFLDSKKKITELLLQAKEDSPALLPLVPVPAALHSW